MNARDINAISAILTFAILAPASVGTCYMLCHMMGLPFDPAWRLDLACFTVIAFVRDRTYPRREPIA